jgi:GTP cyclohydrolase II
MARKPMKRTRVKRAPKRSPRKPSLPHIDLSLVAAERAAGDLRRGLPVIILPARGRPSLIAAAELANAALIAALTVWAKHPPHVLLTHNRARTLKIRLYTDEVVAVPLPQDERVRAALVLADPTRDLRDPLMGPWAAERKPLSPVAREAVRLAKIAGLLPAVLEAALDARAAVALAKREGLIAVKADDIAGYDSRIAATLAPVARAKLPLADAANSHIVAYRPASGGNEHLALIVGEPEPPGPVLVRLHSECLTGDLLGSLKCDCGDQLRGAIKVIGKHGAGVLLYLAQEGRGIGLINKLRAYELQDQGFDTIQANERLGFEADERIFAAAAEMLKQLGFTRVRLLTNNPDKVEALTRFGIEVVERVPHAFPANPHNEAYLATKKAKAGHVL